MGTRSRTGRAIRARHTTAGQAHNLATGYWELHEKSANILFIPRRGKIFLNDTSQARAQVAAQIRVPNETHHPDARARESD
jgi:hypothetical protein